MTVTLHPTGAASATLCPMPGLGSELLQSPYGRKFSGGREVQSASAFRAANKRVFNRRNAQRTFAFSVTREHASPLAAEAFQHLHPQESMFDMPSGSSVVLAESGSSWTLMGAQFQSVDVAELKGRVTKTSYSVLFESASGASY